MIKNIQSLMDKSKNFAKENGLSVQEVLQNYMFERFLERLSKSEYKENFIIKGRFFAIVIRVVIVQIRIVAINIAHIIAIIRRRRGEASHHLSANPKSNF